MLIKKHLTSITNSVKSLIMKSIFSRSLFLITVVLTLHSFSEPAFVSPKIKEQVVTYNSDGITFKSYVAYDENISGKRPAILVIPEWWGLNEYARHRARQLAGLGYIAMAVDMYGDGKTASNPQEAQAFTKPFYSDPQLAKARLDEAIIQIRKNKFTDADNIAAIGYCFGGNVVLNAAKLGADLKGVVSFHGGLGGAPADKKLLKSKILVCNGEADNFVSQQSILDFKHSMDSIGANYQFRSYADATHAFTNPDATKTGKQFNMPIEYNAAADEASWNDMKTFFLDLFAK
jgi:dienelactone hydrolase